MALFAHAIASTADSQSRPMPASLRARAHRTFGEAFDDVNVTVGAMPEDTLAMAWGNRIAVAPRVESMPRFVREAILAHELAHIAQQRRATQAHHAPLDPRRLPAGDRGMVEANADAGAMALLTGQRAAVVAAPLALSRCAVPTGTAITPAHFAFRQVVPIRPGDGDPAGWQAASVSATMSKSYGSSPYGSTLCNFEVGVPLRNYLGPVSTTYAQSVAAQCANSSAYAVLSGVDVVGAQHCIAFRALMQECMGELIPGARVSTPITPGLPVRRFP